ncbi:glycosyltransferase [Armatimonas rosea]|uniref:Lipopolysaccharide biosynthesis glycosyltransferase n=1 Tax=Armatimonas rosea TaxID=685828 RepID=A0A7W9W7Z5_ARMRO|nr:glycosyltransferase [Armatimonas rosea]MBB6052969.1 lipopolysaccharide biosynthesis glycosyltransferase [Armatimonas rosea]
MDDGLRRAAVTGCDKKYIEGAKTLLASIEKHQPDVKRYCLTISEDYEEVKQGIGSLAEVHAVPRSIKVVSSDLQPAVLRLFMPCLPVDIAVWFDCDVIMCSTSPELWSVNPGEVLAVLDTAYSRDCWIEDSLKKFYRAQYPDLIDKRGFNSGVFAIRCSEWLDLPERYEQEFEMGKYPTHPRIFDQPMLNGLMASKVRYLPFKFNAHNLFDHKIPKDVRVIHYTGRKKPWGVNFSKCEPSYYYWLKFGLCERNEMVLLLVYIKILLRAPIRLLFMFLKNRQSFFNYIGDENK